MRIDAYMQVNQLYNTNKSKNGAKSGKTSSKDSLEISSFGSAYQVAKQAASQSSDVREEKSGRRWQQEHIRYLWKMLLKRWQINCFLSPIGGISFGEFDGGVDSDLRR